MEQHSIRREKVDRALANVSQYKKIFKILCDNKTSFIQKLKRNFRNHKSEMLFGKYRMVERVLGRMLSAESFTALKGSNPYKKSDKVYMYLLTDLPTEKVEKITSSVPYFDYERKGEVFAKDIIIPAGELYKADGTNVSNVLFKDIQAINLLPASINPKTNKIEIEKEVLLGKKGDTITEDQDKMIKILGIKNREYKAVISGHTEVVLKEE